MSKKISKKDVYKRQIVQHTVSYKEFTIDHLAEKNLNDVITTLSLIREKYGGEATLDINGTEYEVNIYIHYMGPETDEQYNRRIKYYEQDVEWEKTAKKVREENERKTYERLKKKFDRKS
jgi:hypothetical protein